MTEPAYPLAAAAAEVVEAFFARQVSPRGGSAAPIVAPDPAAVATMVNAAFWASLRREEGRPPRISLAFMPPHRAGQPLLFERSLPLAPDLITRLAPAVERPGIHLGVWRDQDEELRVWGAARNLPDLCLVLEVVEPGLLVLKYRRGPEFGKFGNIAVVRGDRIQVVDEEGGRVPARPALLEALLGVKAPVSWGDAGNELVQLAVSMRGHGRGGSLLVVPGGSNTWRESIVQPVGYGISPPFTRLAELLRLPPEERGRAGGRDGVRVLVDTTAGVTAVDGAAIINDGYEVLAFGATIRRRDGHSPVEQVVVTEPVLDDVPVLASPAQLGGTRHLSAAQFVHDQQDAIALVASQDGRFTVFAWSPLEGMVHAHRIEALLF
ncbi:MAG: putative sensor domain DACNV-containing protein [Gemmatimonadales bacterium]